MLLDIEKIEYVISNRTTQDRFTELFTDNLKKFTVQELADFSNTFKKMEQLVWKAATWSSSFIYDNHQQLSEIIISMYHQLSSMLDKDLEQYYLTDKLVACVSFFNYLKIKKAVC